MNPLTAFDVLMQKKLAALHRDLAVDALALARTATERQRAELQRRHEAQLALAVDCDNHVRALGGTP